MGTQHGGPIFVSYRRDDSAHVAGRIVDRIAAHFPDRRVFFDVNSIGAGTDFVEAVTNAVISSDVVLAVIGKQWAGGTHGQGQSRLHSEEDVIRLELVTALRNDVPIVPVLIDGASMPTQRDLPAPMKPLARRKAVPLDHERFDQDASRLLRELDKILAEAGSRSRPVSADSFGATGAGKGYPVSGEFAVVKTVGEVRELSRRGGVMLVTDRAERGSGQSHAVKKFRQGNYKIIQALCSPLGIQVAWANVGPIIFGNELTRFMAEQGLRYVGCHLFVDGVLVDSQRADDLWGSEKWPTSAGAARILLERHFPASGKS